MNKLPAGYLSQEYAESLSEFGQPLRLPNAGGWLLVRQIPNSHYADAMGCYPVFSCANWDQLQTDLDYAGKNLVAVSLVADSFGDFTLPQLEKAFDRVVPFKSHFAIDLSKEPASFISQHHRYYVKRALKTARIEIVANLPGFIEEWVALYSCLVERHTLKGIKAFSRAAFEKLFAAPGLTAFRAIFENKTIGAHLWFAQGTVVHSHLAAFSEEGYKCSVAYALYDAAIAAFKEKHAWLNIGAGAGTDQNADDGLTRFKKGWATDVRTAYLCGKVFDSNVYNSLAIMTRTETARYFPAYRSGEF